MTDKELMEQALGALEKHAMQRTYAGGVYIANVAIALRERLAQPEPDFYGYASRLAVAIWEQHYKDVAPQWKPFDDLIGVLTQIDNMTAGLALLARPEQEPLTDEQIKVIWRDIDGSEGMLMRFARAIEAAHGIKGDA